MCLNWKALDIYIFQTLDIACQEAFLKVDELSDVDLVDLILRLEWLIWFPKIY